MRRRSGRFFGAAALKICVHPTGAADIPSQVWDDLECLAEFIGYLKDALRKGRKPVTI